MARRGTNRSDRIDPQWPAGASDHEHPVSELASDRQGSLSPFGDEPFPLPAEQLPYEHPVTVINR
ncbi:MAG TPA: hypothetical protein VH333_02000 [Pseudonocardiaceae bacterium]|nr:hypothetical protein [Pseudonocardiaceae bacterium]